ncbi:MAG: hypothetical protein EPO26_16905 [Chloroflexota bacterium]|nr:MAG: hypothetical protein EPO26_16905 [Chloroflexota bacterium]
MVLSSISPLFILWAIRGSSVIPDGYFILFCIVMVMTPNACLLIRIQTARRLVDKKSIKIGKSDDHRDHILLYLFAMLIPFYSADLGTLRLIGAAITALAFIVFLFWHLNLHYMNLLFALFGFRVFTIYPPTDSNPHTGKTSQVLITRRVFLVDGDQLIVYRLSDTVYMEIDG